MSRRMGKVEQRLEFVCSDKIEEAKRAMGYAIFGLKSEILHEVDQKVIALRGIIEAKMNETH